MKRCVCQNLHLLKFWSLKHGVTAGSGPVQHRLRLILVKVEGMMLNGATRLGRLNDAVCPSHIRYQTTL